MRLKLYRAADMAEAMSRVRAEMGPEALILSSRRVTGGVEVTAALEQEPPPAAAPPQPPPRGSPASSIQRASDQRPSDHRGAPHDPVRAAAFAWHGVQAGLASRLAAGPLPFALATVFRFGRLPLEPGGRPLLLVGPPGAGKTLTAARLATRLVMGGIAPLVVTTDGKRAGAAEQLAAFTRLLDLQLLVASGPVALARALARRGDGTPVLIDTPGTDPFDPAQCEELTALAATATADIAVVLPAGLDVAEATDLAAAYAACGGTFLVATRLDLARRLGAVLAAAAAGLMPAEAGIGPGAADGLVPFTPDLLAQRLMRVPETSAKTGTRPP